MTLLVEALDKPSKDDFYDTPSKEDLEKPPGTVLKSRYFPGTVKFYDTNEVTEASDPKPLKVKPYKKGVQLKFVSTDGKGKRIGAVANVLIPYNSKVDKIMSFADGNVYSDKDCAVSYTMQDDGAGSNIVSILQQGWTIVQPDSKGLDAAFGANIRGGNIILDSLKAATAHKSVGAEKNARIGLWSFSFGSTSVAWAAETQPKYAPDLNLVGVVLGSTLANITEVLLNVNDEALSYLIAPTLEGLTKEYPELEKYFKPDDEESFQSSRNRCAPLYMHQDILSELDDGKGVFSNPTVAKIMNNMTLGSSAPKVPMLVLHGTKDEVAPIESVESTIKKYCDKGTPSLQYYKIQGANHTALTYQAYDLASNWISDRLDGKKISGKDNECSSKPHTTSIDPSAAKITWTSGTPTPSATSTVNNEDSSSDNSNDKDSSSDNGNNEDSSSDDGNNAGSFFPPAFLTSAILSVLVSCMVT